MNCGTISTLAWSGWGEQKTGKKVSRKDWPRFVLHMKPDLRKRSQFRARKDGMTVLIRPE